MFIQIGRSYIDFRGFSYYDFHIHNVIIVHNSVHCGKVVEWLLKGNNKDKYKNFEYPDKSEYLE